MCTVAQHAHHLPSLLCHHTLLATSLCHHLLTLLVPPPCSCSTCGRWQRPLWHNCVPLILDMFHATHHMPQPTHMCPGSPQHMSTLTHTPTLWLYHLDATHLGIIASPGPCSSKALTSNLEPSHITQIGSGLLASIGFRIRALQVNVLIDSKHLSRSGDHMNGLPLGIHVDKGKVYAVISGRKCGRY